MFRTILIALFATTVHANPSAGEIVDVEISQCPADVTVTVRDFTLGGQLAIIGGTGAGGEYSIVPTKCAGTYFLMDGPLQALEVVDFVPNVLGRMEIAIPVDAVGCGGDIGAIQAIDLETCETSQMFEL